MMSEHFLFVGLNRTVSQNYTPYTPYRCVRCGVATSRQSEALGSLHVLFFSTSRNEKGMGIDIVV